MWHIHSMEYHTSLNKREILMSATTRMNLEDIMLSEMTLSPKDKYYAPCIIWVWCFLYEVHTRVKFTGRKLNGGCQKVRWGGNKECVFKENHFSWKSGDEGWWGLHTVWKYLIPQIYTLKNWTTRYILCYLFSAIKLLLNEGVPNFQKHGLVIATLLYLKVYYNSTLTSKHVTKSHINGHGTCHLADLAGFGVWKTWPWL
jgi:hypothetical protein